MTTEVVSPADEALAAGLRGFGPVGIAAFVAVALVGPVLLPLSAGVLVLLWVRASHTPWQAIGYVRPASWWRTVTGGLALGVGFKLVMKILVMPLLGAPPLNQAYHFLAGDLPAVLAMAAYVVVAAGFSEETLYRGFLFERFESLLGSGLRMKMLIVIITSLWFAAAHYADQGVPGVEQAAVTGLVFGAIFARTRRIWMLMVAHAAFDLSAIAIIYLDLESALAHLVFK